MEFKPEQPITPEYSYEEGLNRSIAIILERLKKQSHVVIAFNVSGTNIGKSKLAKDIKNKLEEQGFRSCVAHDPSKLQIETGRKQMVFIFNEMEWHAIDINLIQRLKKIRDQEVKIECKKFGYDVSGIDLWIGIYTPDQPFLRQTGLGDQAMPIADIIIRNTDTTEKVI